MMLETLESRTMFSADVLGLTETAVLRQEMGIKAAVHVPNVKGTWNGTLKLRGIPAPVRSAMQVKKQTGAKISGMMFIGGQSAPFKSTLKGNKLTASWSAATVGGTLTGTFSGHTFSGTVKVHYGPISYSGTFKLTK